MGARRPPRLTRPNKKSGKIQGSLVSVSLVWRRNTVQIVQVFQGRCATGGRARADALRSRGCRLFAERLAGSARQEGSPERPKTDSVPDARPRDKWRPADGPRRDAGGGGRSGSGLGPRGGVPAAASVRARPLNFWNLSLRKGGLHPPPRTPSGRGGDANMRCTQLILGPRQSLDRGSAARPAIS